MRLFTPAGQADTTTLVGTADAEGTMGGDTPNAPDLQIGASIAMMNTHEDLRPLLEGRPSTTQAIARFSDFPGHMPAGVLPRDWIPVGKAG